MMARDSPVTGDAGPDLPAAGLSIQGERTARRAAAVWATDDEAADYARHQPDEVIACREAGRHVYPATRQSLAAGPPFTDITPEGFYVRELPCDRCRHVNADGTPGLPRIVRREVWDVKHTRGRITSAQLVSAVPVVVDPDYLNPKGQGRIKPRQVRAAIVGEHLKGQKITNLRREILAVRDERERAVRAVYERGIAAAEREADQLRAVGDPPAESEPAPAAAPDPAIPAAG
jgi:hypothetical protein